MADTVDAVNANLAKATRHLSFTHILNVDSEKNLEVGLYVAAFNYLRLSNLIKAIEDVEWHRPGEVQLLVKPDRDGEGGKFEDIELTLKQAPQPTPYLLRMPYFPRGLNPDRTPRR